MAAAASREDLLALWEPVRDHLRRSLPPSTFRLRIEPLRPVSVQGPSLFLTGPEPVRAWVARRYGTLIEAALRAHGSGLEAATLVPDRPSPGPATDCRRPGTPARAQRHDPGHTFERFVIGAENRLAHAAALAVAELPGEAYNPLFLHGPPGLGKSHLLGAIADYLRRQRPELEVQHTTAEQFTSEFVTALRRDGPQRFKDRYRGLDALLIDDVQFLEGKAQTQEEFVHTFNALHAGGKQIVLSSDRPPEALSHLAERLRDRFGWGLCAELNPPDLRTRTALVWRFATTTRAEVAEPMALHALAGRVAGNVRRLEGATTRVAALSSVLREPITSALVSQALAGHPHHEAAAIDSSPPPSTEPASVKAIQAAVCDALDISQTALVGPTRVAKVVAARQLAIYLTRELTGLSLARIAAAFNRDHTTILHATRAVAGRLGPNTETTRLVHRLRAQLEPPTPPSLPPVHHDRHPPQTSSTQATGSQSR